MEGFIERKKLFKTCDFDLYLYCEAVLKFKSQIFRPSGTEPKLKTYLMIQKPISQDVEASFEEAKNMGERLKKALGDYFEV